MSVITFYTTTAYDEENQTIDLQAALINRGVLSMISKETGTLDLNRCCSEEWQKELQYIQEKGVITYGNPFEALNEDGSLKPQFANSYLAKVRPFPDPTEDGRRVYCYELKDGIIYEVSRNKQFDVASIQKKPLSKEESVSFIEQATQLINSYEKRKEGGYRRNYTPQELENVAHPIVAFKDDRTSLSYYRNHNPYDDRPIYYLSKALPEVILHNVFTTEGALDADYYCQDGELLHDKLNETPQPTIF